MSVPDTDVVRPDVSRADRRAEATLLRGILDHLPHAVIAVDARWRLVAANAPACRMLARPVAAMLGVALWELFPELSASDVGRCCRAAAADGRAHAAEGELPGIPGWFRVHVMPAAEGHFVLHARDVTAERRLEPELAGARGRDALTGAANRRTLVSRLAAAIDQARAGHGRGSAMLLLDLDGFRALNVAHGHDVGDRLLRHVAERIGRAARGSDTVARIAADEFAVLLEGAAPEEAAIVGARILAAIAAPLLPGDAADAAPADGTPRDAAIIPSACLATVVIDGDDDGDADAVLRDAGLTLQRARAAGPGRLETFTPALREEARARDTLAAALRGALARTLQAGADGTPERGELSLAYQPVLDLRSGAATSVEALLRWRHPELGPVSPAVFIPLAEELGLIEAIGTWVLRTACAAIAAFGPPDGGAVGAALGVAVNVSGHQLASGDFADEVAAALAAAGLAPDRLTVEVTETALVRDARRARRVLGELRTTGVRVAIDDFGTGYSSLGYLQQLPLDVLEIDKRFVDGVARGGGPSVAIPRAIIALGGALGLRTVAEGVEMEAQRAALHALGCDRGQGYLFARPLAPAGLAAWLAARSEVG